MNAKFLTLIAGAAAAAALASAALAASPAIEAAKDACIVGEQADGYLGVVDAAKADEALRREVRDTNQQRKAAYERISERNGVTVDVTAALTAERLIAQAGPGECVRDGSGAWIKM